MSELKKYSGYISNKRELAAIFGDLKDEQYIVKAYDKWGEDMVDYLHGMFAFIIYDEQNNRLFGARDRFGNESLYYCETEDKSLLYGLTIKDILANEKCIKKINHVALELYLTYSYLPGKNTFFEGIKKVMPGHTIKYENGQLILKRYWKPEYRPDKDKSIDEYANEINDTLNMLVEDWKQPGEVYGNFLSGGVDSAYLAALTKPAYTFSTAYDNKEFDESALAAETASYLGTEHIKINITPDEYFDIIPEAMRAMEQPLADASTIAFCLACKGAKKYVDICYSGEGADELFCGYHAYTRRLTNLLDKNYPNAPVEQYYIGNTKVMNEEEKKSILKEYTGELSPLELANSLYDFDDDTDDITKMWLCDLNVWFEGDIMLNAEKMSKANKLTARTPFLDTRLYEVACKIPSEYKVSTEQSKIVFRKAAAKMIPESVAFRKKLGFAVPARVWMEEEPYISRIREVFSSDCAELFFEKDKILNMLTKDYMSKTGNWRKIWNIYIFLVWYKQFF